MLSKFTSRKFIMALATVIAGICSLFGGEEAAAQVAGAVTALASAVTYIVSEGSIDRSALFYQTHESNGYSDEEP